MRIIWHSMKLKLKFSFFTFFVVQSVSKRTTTKPNEKRYYSGISYYYYSYFWYFRFSPASYKNFKFFWKSVEKKNWSSKLMRWKKVERRCDRRENVSLLSFTLHNYSVWLIKSLLFWCRKEWQDKTCLSIILRNQIQIFTTRWS